MADVLRAEASVAFAVEVEYVYRCERCRVRRNVARPQESCPFCGSGHKLIAACCFPRKAAAAWAAGEQSCGCT